MSRAAAAVEQTMPQVSSAGIQRRSPAVRLQHRSLRLAPQTIAVSVSESPDLASLGMFELHLQRAMGEVASQLLASGRNLAYGGDLRKDGFTDSLLGFLYSYQGHPDHQGLIHIIDYLAWPVHIRMPNDSLRAWYEETNRVAELVLLQQDGARMDWVDRFTKSPHEPTTTEWQEGLTAMRKVMQTDSHARLVLGGRIDGYRGRMPGVAEEILFSLQEHTPLYLLGGFGGCSHDVAVSLGLMENRVGRQSCNWRGADEFRSFDVTDLANGLDEKENARLVRTRAIGEAMTLVRRGLHRLDKASGHGKNKW